MGVHFVVQNNLESQSLFDIKIESFMMNLYGDFNLSPKKHLEFQILAQILESNDKKVIKNV
jgi:hypothetical protein